MAGRRRLSRCSPEARRSDTGATSFATDQRGVPRGLGAADDIGAYEYTGAQSGPNFVVTQTGDAGDGLADPAGVRDGTTLREAIAAANLFPTRASSPLRQPPLPRRARRSSQADRWR